MQDVTKMFGPVGVRNLTLTVPEGSLMGLVGPSGCGKTTTVRLLLGVYGQDSGVMAVLGEDPAQLSARTRARIGYMPQHYMHSQRMTVWGTMNFVASLYGMLWFKRRRQLRQALQFVGLDDAGIDVRHVDAYHPSFDEVFVDLMQKLDPEPEPQLRASEEVANV
jgi:ABC-2 type transport system ATP-binding protein